MVAPGITLVEVKKATTKYPGSQGHATEMLQRRFGGTKSERGLFTLE
jgi:hypothetical protein